MKSKLVIYGIFLAANLPSYSQTKRMDSLMLELLDEKGSARFSILYELVFEYLDKEDYQEALKYIEEAQQVAAQYDDRLRIVKAGRVKGQILGRLDRMSDAINEFEKVLSISRRNNFIVENEFILNTLANAYGLVANYDKALRYHFECLVLREKRGNREDINETLNNIGVVYHRLGNNEKELECYQRILRLAGKIDFKDQLLINIGLCYNELKDFPAAKKYIEEGMNLCAPHCTELRLAQGELGLGISLFSLNRLQEAEKHFRTSHKLSQKIHFKQFQIANLIYLARINKILGRHDDARIHLADAEAIASETQYIESLMAIYKLYSELYNQTKDYENVAFYLTKYLGLHDSVYSEELTKNLMKIQAEYEERENKAKIASQEQILKLKDEAINRQSILNFLVGTVALLFVTLALILARVNRDKQRVNVLLEQKVKERTRSLEASLEALQGSHSDLREFIRKTCNDIRSPVVTMKGLSAVMLADSENPQTTRENVKQFEQIIFSLSELQDRLSMSNRKLRKDNDANGVKE